MRNSKGKLFRDHPKEVVLEYDNETVAYEIFQCRETDRGIFCEAYKNGKHLSGICLNSLLNSRFYKKEEESPAQRTPHTLNL